MSIEYTAGTRKDRRLQTLFHPRFSYTLSRDALPQSSSQHGLVGAIQRLSVNGDSRDGSGLADDASDSAGLSRYRGPPCAAHSCANGGVCAPRLAAYVCACRPGFHGHRCEKGVIYKYTYVLVTIINIDFFFSIACKIPYFCSDKEWRPRPCRQVRRRDTPQLHEQDQQIVSFLIDVFAAVFVVAPSSDFLLAFYTYLAQCRLLLRYIHYHTSTVY